MLSNNNMLVPGGGGGGRQRARGTVRVSEPAYGFFIAGSKIEAMNGVYIRRNPPRFPKEDSPRHALYYEHEEGKWHMALNELINEEEAGEESDDDVYYWRPKKKKPTHEWVFMDELGKSRFVHDGDTIVPGAGVRWSHVKAKSPSTSADGTEGAHKSILSSASSTSSAVTEVVEDDEDELPWQVIAILDIDMVQQLLWSSECRKQRVREAKAGKNASAASKARASLEGTFAPGRWLFKVVATEGVVLRVESNDESEEAGRREVGEYVRGIKLTTGGDWLCLDACEDLAVSSRSSRGGRYFNADYSRRQLWVRVVDSTNAGEKVLMEEVENCPVMDLKKVGEQQQLQEEDATNDGSSNTNAIEAEASGGGGLSGDYFDRPFIPRMEDGSSTDVAVESIEDPQPIPSSSPVIGVPVGAAVEITGLKSRSGLQYNGVSGVVLTPVLETGRQGVRLDAPFSGKVLSCKPDMLLYVNVDEEHGWGQLENSARLLGLTLPQLHLSQNQSEESDTAGSIDSECHWGFGGSTPMQRFGCAYRASIRDVGSDMSPSRKALQDAADVILAELQKIGAAADKPFPTASLIPARSPEMMVRAGSIGSTAAAAVSSTTNPLSNEEREAGLRALQELLREETYRARIADASVMISVGEDSLGCDELLLRLALVQALLSCRREAEALEEAQRAAKFDESCTSKESATPCPAVSFLLAKCLLRLGRRADGLKALEQAESACGVVAGDAGRAWITPLWVWGKEEAAKLLLSSRTAEKCRVAAVDIYAKGSFMEAAQLFQRSISILKAGCSDDKRGIAVAYCDRAGCLRRARKLEDAVLDLNVALSLFPRFTRALFRRAACLLELGKAAEAVEAFNDLYRVDRDWPQLSDWLVRAFTLLKRQKTGYKSSTASSEDNQYENPSSSTSSSSSSTAPNTTPTDAEKIALEVDHYAVLGVSTDATEKQLKTAYRMRSLQFHPDRAGQGGTAAFQRIAEAFQVLSDPDKRRAFDEGSDIKVKRGKRDDDDDDDDSEDEEEHKTTMKEEVERDFYPERYSFWPFGDPFIYKRKRAAQKKAEQEARERRAGGGSRPAWSWNDD